MTSPDFLPVRPENIPGELKALPQWVMWRAVQRGEKWTKPPFMITGENAKSTDPDTWTTFEQALETYRAGKFDGIGFVFAKDGGFTGIDFDHCLDDAKSIINPQVKSIVDNLASYCEVSAGGAGLHLIVRGKLESGSIGQYFEVYPHGRFFTVTGHILGEPKDIADGQAVITLLSQLAEVKKAQVRSEKPAAANPLPSFMPSAEYSEIEQQVLDSMAAHGITPHEQLILDGERHRIKINDDRLYGSEQSGAYCIYIDSYPAGWFMDWHNELIKWKFDIKKLNSEAQAQWKRYFNSREYQAAQQSRQLQREVEQRQESDRRREAVNEAWRVYSSAKSIEEAPDHPYLLAKRVTPRGGFPFGGQWCGLRTGDMASRDGNPMRDLLLIPTMNAMTGRFCGLHRIFGRPGADGKFNKGWCSPAGGVFPIGVDIQHGVVFAGEGIATVLSWYQYWNEESENVAPCTAIAAMDAGNLIKNAAAIRARYRERDVFILQDDDEAGEKAAAACMASGFAGVVNPRDYIR
ncbi:MAG: toprim domain-containing protein [Synergistaceae bacterium]|jgi:phage/plasmid primase-like uncharacterized protein|nr:toprim domain-containing protein [Synergistaceae bacterium]